jgi:hypothetical protein
MDAATEQSAPEAEVVDRVGPQRRGRQWAARRHTRQPGSCEADKGGPPDKSLRRAPAIHGRSGSNIFRRAPSKSATNDALAPCSYATQS